MRSRELRFVRASLVASIVGAIKRPDREKAGSARPGLPTMLGIAAGIESNAMQLALFPLPRNHLASASVG
jgi:hypothetical protein